jgi:hypothetical protein
LYALKAFINFVNHPKAVKAGAGSTISSFSPIITIWKMHEAQTTKEVLRREERRYAKRVGARASGGSPLPSHITLYRVSGHK